MSKKLLGLLFFIFSQVIWADELVIVTTISSSKKRFVINQGTNSNIVPNQTRAFSTDNISLMCYAVETSPDHSLWQVQDQNAFIPFLKNQFVLMHTNLMDERTQKHLYVEREKIQKLKETGELLFEDFDYETNQMGLYHLAKRPNWILRGGLGHTFYDSLSSADASQQTTKSQVNLEGLYSQRVFSYRFDFGFGFRWDQEAEEVKDEDLVIPIRRFMLISEISYHANKMKGTLNNFYFGAGTGIGKTSMEVDEYNFKGISYLFPYLKIGLLSHLQKKFYLISEISVENLISNTKVVETGEKQTSSNVNGKFSVGLRF
ncbi:MAG: hypothetical protein A2381_06380 [Bdellovibrionales bacterium RIFOXYB1_FULL_37_110]|nr:MAG: hypothetical protein A2181_08400 [Bdellovibrionales bacterium RIFOXYA1_FULL_38_20]OFZ50168.1 MAG: hypothetical protein A2417_19230 [Bdellovibrionales bacterium RIFOXYC1_FULL_37_79]OFZ57605.1 MAG: hypothetical protein A2381_06380 [Bdellovibrionales bacterium RIFOXYB1_FULL_37_110]OFZ61372.1 MAG: hypothetical protein A2577_00745 [Bdellovibrionales bacterium RIFOXYD1_FULL_36_51]